MKVNKENVLTVSSYQLWDQVQNKNLWKFCYLLWNIQGIRFQLTNATFINASSQLSVDGNTFPNSKGLPPYFVSTYVHLVYLTFHKTEPWGERTKLATTSDVAVDSGLTNQIPCRWNNLFFYCRITYYLLCLPDNYFFKQLMRRFLGL